MIAAPPEHFTGAHASRLTMRAKLWRLFQAIRVLVVREVPMVRIRLPPAASHTNFEGHRTQARIGGDQIASWLAGQGRDGFVDRRVVMDGSKRHGDPEGRVRRPSRCRYRRYLGRRNN